MAASEDVLSPPYPGEGTTALVLWSMLGELGDWVRRSRDAVNQSAGREIVALPAPFPAKSTPGGQSVLDQFRTLMFLRRLRESWDNLVRTYEHEWDSPDCLRTRALLLTMACDRLEHWVRPYEHREAQATRRNAREAYTRVFDRLSEVLFALWEPPDGTPIDDLS